VAPALGEGIEPGDIRQFAPGDRIRQVNWRASLRLGALYVTEHHRERNADVVLMLDTLAEVGPPRDGTLDLGVRATASLAAAYLARKDRVGLINYGGTIDWVRPATGRAQYERLADTLLRAAVVFTYVSKDLAFVPPRVLPPSTPARSTARLLAVRGEVHDGPTGAAARVVRTGVRRARRRDGDLRCCAAAGEDASPAARTDGETLPSDVPCARASAPVVEAMKTRTAPTHVR